MATQGSPDFWDERQSDQESMNRYYEQGPPEDWPDHFISAYASMHPWEDWAESWGHYLHIADTLGSSACAGNIGISIN